MVNFSKLDKDHVVVVEEKRQVITKEQLEGQKKFFQDKITEIDSMLTELNK